MIWDLKIIDWNALAAIGTFLAVIVSLILARSDHKEKIKIYPHYYGGMYDENYGGLKYIKIQNISHNDIYIEDIVFEPRETLNSIKIKMMSKYSIKELILDPDIVLNYLQRTYLSEGVFTPNEFTHETPFKESTTVPTTLKSSH